MYCWLGSMKVADTHSGVSRLGWLHSPNLYFWCFPGKLMIGPLKLCSSLPVDRNKGIYIMHVGIVVTIKVILFYLLISSVLGEIFYWVVKKKVASLIYVTCRAKENVKAFCSSDLMKALIPSSITPVLCFSDYIFWRVCGTTHICSLLRLQEWMYAYSFSNNEVLHW